MILNLNFKPKDLNGNTIEAWDTCGKFIAASIISASYTNPIEVFDLAKKCNGDNEFEVSLEDINFLREFNKKQLSYNLLVQVEIENQILIALNN